MTAAETVRSLLVAGRLDIPPLGGGHTPARWRSLFDLARADLGAARLAEAHVDAVQILREAGRRLPEGDLAGVWASEHPRHRVVATPTASGGLALRGTKGFCGGASIVDRALVTTEAPDGVRLVEVELDQLGADRIDGGGWRTPALADTHTATVDLSGVEVGPDALVGGPGWYLDRPGFWHGAIGPAACWAGGAAGLVDHALALGASDDHAAAHLGALTARVWAFEAVLDRAGREIDDASSAASRTDEARTRALVVRGLVDDGCAEVQERFGRVTGPRSLVADPEVIARDMGLRLYRRQCHAERDLASIVRPAPRDRPA